MADAPKDDPDSKKEIESWFVEGLEPSPVKKAPPKPPAERTAPPSSPPPQPNGKPPSKMPLALTLLALLALLAYGGYTMRFRKSKVDEAMNTVVPPKTAEENPPPAVIEPVVPAAPEPAPKQQKKTVVTPARKPTPKPFEPIPTQQAEKEPAAPKAPPKVEAPPKPEQPAAPASGIMLWSGKVDKNGTIVIDGSKSDSGRVNGAVLPGVPVAVRVEPKGFTISEPPSAANGWKRVAIHSQKKAHIVVTVFWNTTQ